MGDAGRRSALITGATSGIGAAFARQLASEGYALILTGRREEKLRALAEELARASGVAVEIVIAELANPAEVKTLASKIKTTPDLEVLINNAGFGSQKPFHEEEIGDQEKMVSVHILTAMRLTHAALPQMLARGKGIIINVSSLAAFAPLPRGATYSATKAFLSSFSEAISMELAGTGVKVQALCPGFTRTDFHERLGIDRARLKSRGIVRWIAPERVVNASFRCLKRNRVICVPGFWNRVILLLLSGIIPRRLYYWAVSDYRDRKRSSREASSA